MTKVSELKDRLRRLNGTYRSVSDLKKKKGQLLIAEGPVRFATKEEIAKIRSFLAEGKQPLSMLQQQNEGR